MNYYEWVYKVKSILINAYQMSSDDVQDAIYDMDDGEGTALYNLYCEDWSAARVASRLAPSEEY